MVVSVTERHMNMMKKFLAKLRRVPAHWLTVGVFALVCGTVLAVDHFTRPLVVSLHGYNYMDRSIFNYTVNGAMGANVLRWSRGGGGKTACCAEIDGDRVQIEWAISGTLEEVMADIPPKTYSREVGLPPRPAETPTFLEVHFLSNDNIVLRWNTWIGEPIAPIYVDPEDEKRELKAAARRREIVDRAAEAMEGERAAGLAK